MSCLRWLWMFVLATAAGCATSPAWPPRVERLPEGAAGPIAPLRSSPVTLDEVVAMAHSGTSAGFIIQTLRDSRTSHAISAEQAAVLGSRGVPDEVLAYLRYGERGIVPDTHAPAYPPEPYAYGYPYYGYWPYGFYSPYRGYPRSGLYFGFGRHW